jgi:uncharacterized protein YbjQ (UPF0145 family)
VSPLFGRRRGAAVDPALLEAEAQRDAESLARLEQGRIPLRAAERLAALASAEPGAGAFSSDLSVDEFALLHRLGIEPVTVVMGSSIYHVGWQNVYYDSPTEVAPISHAYNESRRLALARLLEETETAGADAVVGVRVQQGSHDWAVGSVEFVVVGTAVRLPEALRGDRGPVLTDLDGQGFWQLCTQGIRPVGIVAATSVHYAPAGMQTMRAQSGMFGAAWVNQELPDYTRGVYAARHRAMHGLTEQARALGADGIVGVRYDQHMRGNRVARPMTMEREDLIVTLHAMGTAICEDPALAQAIESPPVASTILNLSAPPALRPTRPSARLT